MEKVDKWMIYMQAWRKSGPNDFHMGQKAFKVRNSKSRNFERPSETSDGLHLDVYSLGVYIRTVSERAL